MTTNTKIIFAFGVGLASAISLRKAYKAGKEALSEHDKKVWDQATERCVDNFITAVVTCRELTIESKHNGSARVRIITD